MIFMKFLNNLDFAEKKCGIQFAFSMIFMKLLKFWKSSKTHNVYRIFQLNPNFQSIS